MSIVKQLVAWCQYLFMTENAWTTAAALLALATELVDGVQQGLTQRGFDDVRPAHGFTFSLLSGEGATTADVAEHLGVTKQAASQLVEHLVTHDYVTRRPDPRDARARLLVLTPRGRACTRAAEHAAADVVRRWEAELSPHAFATMAKSLVRLAPSGRLRPAW